MISGAPPSISRAPSRPESPPARERVPAPPTSPRLAHVTPAPFVPLVPRSPPSAIPGRAGMTRWQRHRSPRQPRRDPRSPCDGAAPAGPVVRRPGKRLWWIRAPWSIWCIPVHRIHHQARIHHANPGQDAGNGRRAGQPGPQRPAGRQGTSHLTPGSVTRGMTIPAASSAAASSAAASSAPPRQPASSPPPVSSPEEKIFHWGNAAKNPKCPPRAGRSQAPRTARAAYRPRRGSRPSRSRLLAS